MTDRPNDAFGPAGRERFDEEHETTEGRPVVRDKRRIDPVTGQVRSPAGPPQPEAPGEDVPAGEPVGTTAAERPAGEVPSAELESLRAQVAERTADLQRVTAEYANYRRRVDRDREAVREQAMAAVLAELLPVLDNIDRAREHGEVVGGFKSVAEALESGMGKLGLTRFGEPGEPFDPTVHEALTHSYSTEVDATTCGQVFQPGYRLGERVLRPARVGVVDPEPEGDPTGAATATATGPDSPRPGPPDAPGPVRADEDQPEDQPPSGGETDEH